MSRGDESEGNYCGMVVGLPGDGKATPLRPLAASEPLIGPLADATPVREGWVRGPCNTCGALMDVLARQRAERPGAAPLCYGCWNRRPPRVNEPAERTQRAEIYAHRAVLEVPVTSPLWASGNLAVEVERLVARAFSDGWAARADWPGSRGGRR